MKIKTMYSYTCFLLREDYKIDGKKINEIRF